MTRDVCFDKRDDGEICRQKTYVEIYNLIRALKNPWPCAFFIYKGFKVKIYEAYPVLYSEDVTPGTILDINENGFCVQTGNNSLLILNAENMNFKIGDVLN